MCKGPITYVTAIDCYSKTLSSIIPPIDSGSSRAQTLELGMMRGKCSTTDRFFWKVTSVHKILTMRPFSLSFNSIGRVWTLDFGTMCQVSDHYVTSSGLLSKNWPLCSRPCSTFHISCEKIELGPFQTFHLFLTKSKKQTVNAHNDQYVIYDSTWLARHM